MSLSVIPLTILGQITGVTGSGESALYQVSFKSIDGTPLYGVAAVWTDEQAEIEALAAQKPYGVWINPISGTFTVKFAGYTYVGSADLTDPDVLAGITPIKFNNKAAGGGSEELSMCTLTLVNNTGINFSIYVPNAVDDEESAESLSMSVAEVGTGTTSVSVILYKGTAFALIPTSLSINISGNITDNPENPGEYLITGDGTVTASSK